MVYNQRMTPGRFRAAITSALLATVFAVSCGGGGTSGDAWYGGEIAFTFDAADPDAAPSPDVGVPDGSGVPDAAVTDGGREPCGADRVQYGACPGGDLVTPCEGGWYGAPYCLVYDGGPVDAAPDTCGAGAEDCGAIPDAGYDGGWDVGPFPDAGPDPYASLYQGTGDLSDQDLKDKLYDLVKGHTALGYDNAREALFSDVDNESGWVECVYTGIRVQTTGIPSSSVMNTEHSWPQSKGADVEPERSDLNHIYPTDSKANSHRGNTDYGWVNTATWTEGGSKFGMGYGGFNVFEPRDVHKGNAARSIFYFSIRYRLPVAQEVEDTLKIWNHLDPPDDREQARNTTAEGYQHTRNPFVDHPEFADRIADF